MDRRRQPAPAAGPGVVFLGQVAARLQMLDVACTRCERRGRLNTARLVAEHGADMPVPKLLRILAADCPKMQAAEFHDVCGIHLPQLSKGI
jgi:hypothetical protein